MNFEQALELRTLFETGSVLKAAEKLRKRHPTLLQNLKKLEQTLELQLFDRTGYRTRFTPQGKKALQWAHQVLELHSQIEKERRTLIGSGESSISLVADGILNTQSIVSAIQHTQKIYSTTQFELQCAFHVGVEQTFEKSQAQLMISIVPPMHLTLESIALPSLQAILVAHSKHEVHSSKGKIETFPILTVQGSSSLLKLSTAALEPQSTMQFSDFHAKKIALLAKLGYGWMPEYLISTELKKGILKPVKWDGDHEHRYEPRIYFRSRNNLGKASLRFIEFLKKGKTPLQPQLK